MIEYIHIRNFKSLKEIEFQPLHLNLLMGLNGMGKSSFIQTLLLLRQNRETGLARIALNGAYVEIGKGKDAMYEDNPGDTISIGCVLKEKENRLKLVCELAYQPESNALDNQHQWPIDTLTLHALFNDHFHYLAAERTGPQTDYNSSYVDVVEHQQLGVQGEYTVHYLNRFGNRTVNDSLLHPKGRTNILLHQTNAWLGEISPGVRLNATEITGTDKVLLDYQFAKGQQYTNRFRPRNVGFGISYVLPIIVALLSTQAGDIVIIENPESHIHPRGQVELGRLISLAASTGVQIFVETHSDHIVNGVRVAVKEGLVNQHSINIAYFDKVTTETEQYSRIRSIRVDQKGELSDYPEDFMDEWTNQLLKLI